MSDISYEEKTSGKGPFLKQKRLEAGLTIQDVTKRLGKVSPNAYQRYETGKSLPTLTKFNELLTAINPNISSVLKIA